MPLLMDSHIDMAVVEQVHVPREARVVMTCPKTQSQTRSQISGLFSNALFMTMFILF